MGDPRKLRNKFSRPKRLWDVERLKEDTELKTIYGLRNASEAWKAADELRKYRQAARQLLSLSEEDRKQDADKILAKLARLGVLKKGTLDDILSLEVKDILERRLQTVVYRKGLARSMKQARQLITHGFISVNGKKVSVPSYFVLSDEEAAVAYTKPIDLSAGDHAGDAAPQKPGSKAPDAKQTHEIEHKTQNAEHKTENAKGGGPNA